MIDHVWLVDQRDTLKAASNAAAIAAAQEMNRVLAGNPDIGDDDLQAALQPVAKAYALANLLDLSGARLTRAKATLVVEVEPDRSQNTVDVNVQADLGGFLLAGRLPFLSGVDQIESMTVGARVESVTNPIEVVLAIDVSHSMSGKLDGGVTDEDKGDRSRMDIVRDAAKALVGILGPDADDRVAIGVVPWHHNVRLAAATATDWSKSANLWARYPTKRTYDVPYECQPSSDPCTPDAVVADLSSSAPEDWNGCLDGHRMGSSGTSAAAPEVADLFTLPSANAFSQAYYPSLYGFQYECNAFNEVDDRGFPILPSDYKKLYCYHPYDADDARLADHPPQYDCDDDDPTVLPLSTDRSDVIDAIDGLSPVGNKTYSALGILWGQRMLLSTWRTVWGGTVHPVDPASKIGGGVRKAIVLLTDGDDNFCGEGNVACTDSPMGISRADACTQAKNAGIEIFVVAAMPPDQVSSELGTSLTECSSQSDDLDGTYVFLNNATAETLRTAFTDIATQLVTFRRLH